MFQRAFFLLAMLSCGCSLFVNPNQSVNISCSEADATLKVNGTVYENPTSVDLRKNRSALVECSKPGFVPTEYTVSYSISGTGIADAAGGLLCLVPGIGLITGGGWELDETEVHLQMFAE